jgi:hypothetical protein
MEGPLAEGVIPEPVPEPPSVPETDDAELIHPMSTSRLTAKRSHAPVACVF